jgi:hypothetical protein
VPPFRDAVVKVAWPLARLSDPVKALTPHAPSKKVTPPVGVPAALVTVAVNMTDCPKVDGLSDETTCVFVAGLITLNAAFVVVLLPAWTLSLAA